MTGRTSKCEQAQDPPLSWHLYCDEFAVEVVLREIQALIPAGLTESEVKHRLAQIDAVMDAAREGTLVRAEDQPALKAVRRNPSLWELRWTIAGREWRMYHAEPDELVQHLVALRFHEKWVGGTPDQVEVEQNRQIDMGAGRLISGRPRLWGYVLNQVAD